MTWISWAAVYHARPGTEGKTLCGLAVPRSRYLATWVPGSERFEPPIHALCKQCNRKVKEPSGG